MSKRLLDNEEIKRLIQSGKNSHGRVYWTGVEAGIDFAEGLLNNMAKSEGQGMLSATELREKALSLARQWNPSVNMDILLVEAEKILAYLLKPMPESK